MGKRNVCLKYLITLLALITLNGQSQECFLGAYGKIVDITVYNTIFYNMCTTTMGTLHFFKRNILEFQINCITFVRCCVILIISGYSESMI